VLANNQSFSNLKSRFLSGTVFFWPFLHRFFEKKVEVTDYSLVKLGDAQMVFYL
jgi:hypothetical protein